MGRAGLWVPWSLALVALQASAQRTVRFDSSGKLRVAQLTDMHVGEGSEQDAQTLQLVERVLAAEQPDLAILSGDMVSGFAFPAADLSSRLTRQLHPSSAPHTASWYEQQWRRVVAPLHAAGVPYAAILGNHDGEGDLSRQQITEMMRSVGASLSLTEAGPQQLRGAGNYWLDVLQPEGQGDAVAARIWLLDSGNRGCGRLAWGWGCVPAETVEWVRVQAARLPRVPSLAFIHIPLPQHYLAWSLGPANGTKGELVGCPGVDSGFWELAREFGIHAIYSGHDHNNDFAASLDGIRLAYGRKSGYGSYGPTGGLLPGSRVIELRMGQDTAGSATWIRQADGSQQFQAAAPPAQERPLQQHMCNLDESACDRALGPALCLSLRRARNAAALLAALAGLAAVLAATSAAVVVLARHAQQHARRNRGWRPVATTPDKPSLPGEAAAAV